MNTIQTECSSCSGSGLYRGMAEPRGVAVVCLTCKGTGCAELRYKPFVKRRERTDVDEVRLSRGPTILSCGPTGEAIPYREWLNGRIHSR